MKSVFAALALAVSLAAQGSRLVDGLEAYKKGDYAAAERSSPSRRSRRRPARGTSLLALVQASTGRCADAEPVLAKATGTGDATLRRLVGLALARCFVAAGRLDDAATVTQRSARDRPH